MAEADCEPTGTCGGVDTHAGARHFVEVLARSGIAAAGRRLLVAGCGRGHEAAHLAAALGADTSAVDVDLPDVLPEGPDFSTASVLDLPFSDATFDLVFFHHVIEHVADPAASLAELARVMRPGAVIYVGTPNRHRLVGYVGSFSASGRQKIAWNLADYRARLRGRFRNEFGAHAGFTASELRDLLTRRFVDVRPLTADYFRFKYGRRVPGWALSLAMRPPLREVVPPAVYAIARRG
jgi:SAM-dependent methyltransferase